VVSQKRIVLLFALGFLLIDAALLPAVHAASAVKVGNEPEVGAYAATTKDVYIPNYADGTVSVIDTSSDSVVATLTGIGGESLVYVPSTDAIISFGGGSAGITAYGPLSGTSYIYHAEILLTANDFVAAAYASSNGQVYVADEENAQVMALDPGSMEWGATISVGGSPDAVAFDPTNGYVYVANYADGTVSVIDSSTNTLVTTVGVGLNPSALAYAPSSNAVYVANTYSDTVTVIDASTNVKGATINVGTYPAGVAFASSDDDIYVANEGDNTVSAIDTSSNTVVQTISVGSTPDAAVYSPNSNEVYVSNYYSKSVSTIDASAPTSSSIQTTLSSMASSITGGFSTVEASLTTLSSSLSADYSSLSSAISTLQTALSTDFSTLNSQISTLSTTVTSGFSGLTTQISGLSSDLSSDYASLTSQLSAISSAIANIGVTGPTVGTSNDATVVTSPSFSSRTSFSTAASAWTLVSTSSPNEVLSGYAVSTTAPVTRNAILYVSLTPTPASASATYAIPLGGLGILTSPTGQLRFPFHIPAGSSIYVQVVSSSPASITVQLQMVSEPINP
jgi:YVTN family beta-propeller protein